jgi:hypothetical protein
MTLRFTAASLVYLIYSSGRFPTYQHRSAVAGARCLSAVPSHLAAWGVRTHRNLAALVLAAAGVFLLTHLHIAGEPLGYVVAFGSCVLFRRGSLPYLQFFRHRSRHDTNYLFIFNMLK